MRLSPFLLIFAATVSVAACVHTSAPASGELVHPLPGLTSAQLASFERGRALFDKTWGPADGLGPLYNDTSCRACHGLNFDGDGSKRAVTLVGGLLRGAEVPLVKEGGPAIQDKAIEGMPIEAIPADAKFVSHRISPATMGMGLIEAIATDDITAGLAANPLKESLGIRGEANWEFRAIGRFGWKAQKGDMVEFTQNAAEFEMGLSTPGRPRKDFTNAPPVLLAKAATFNDPKRPWISAYFKRMKALGHPISKPDISKKQLADLVNFQRYEAPVAPLPSTPASMAGHQIFTRLHCDLCHVQGFKTSPNAFGVPAGLSVPLYSDLLVHDMGPAMNDGLIMGVAKGSYWRTAPLWGLRYRRYYLHDGRTSSLEGAILWHGGEATKVVAAYKRLSPDEKSALKAFLSSL